MPSIKAKLELEVVGYGVLAQKQVGLGETEYLVQRIQVANATTDSALSFGGVTTADVFYIASDQQITYKLSGGATAATLDANGLHLLYGTAVTACTVTNASGSTANLVYAVAGA